MSYLIDTLTFLWFITDHASLSSHAENLIQQPDNPVYLSVGSIWEMSIKVSLNRLEMPTPFNEFIDSQLIENRIALLPIRTEHTAKLISLPFHHQDPFDRLLVAQALHEGYTLISKDEIFDPYGVDRQW